ncbi:hypothetical protein ACFL2U_00255 [Patescibacteria group bacterium]
MNDHQSNHEREEVVTCLCCSQKVNKSTSHILSVQIAVETDNCGYRVYVEGFPFGSGKVCKSCHESIEFNAEDSGKSRITKEKAIRIIKNFLKGAKE